MAKELGEIVQTENSAGLNASQDQEVFVAWAVSHLLHPFSFYKIKWDTMLPIAVYTICTVQIVDITSLISYPWLENAGGFLRIIYELQRHSRTQWWQGQCSSQGGSSFALLGWTALLEDGSIPGKSVYVSHMATRGWKRDCWLLQRRKLSCWVNISPVARHFLHFLSPQTDTSPFIREQSLSGFWPPLTSLTFVIKPRLSQFLKFCLLLRPPPHSSTEKQMCPTRPLLSYNLM